MSHRPIIVDRDEYAELWREPKRLPPGAYWDGKRYVEPGEDDYDPVLAARICMDPDVDAYRRLHERAKQVGAVV